MPSSHRRNYRIAASLYFVFVALYLLPMLYLFLPEPIGPARHASAPLGEILGPALLTIVLMLAMCIGLGLGIRAGKTWAKVIFALLLAYVVYVFARALPFFPQRNPWTVTKEVFALVMLLGVGFFLFRQQLTRRSAPAEADRAASAHTPSN